MANEVDGQRKWDVVCAWCGVVSAGWNRPSIAAMELTDHITYHVKGIHIDPHYSPDPVAGLSSVPPSDGGES
jgi:hypothetical protein